MDTRWHEIDPKPLVLKRFVYLDLFNSNAIDQQSKDEKNNRRGRASKKWAPIPKTASAFSKNPRSHLRFSEVKFAKCKPQFLQNGGKKGEEVSEDACRCCLHSFRCTLVLRVVLRSCCQDVVVKSSLMQALFSLEPRGSMM